MDNPPSLTSLSQSLQRVERKNYKDDSESDIRSDTFSQYSGYSAFSFRSDYSKNDEDSVISYL